MRLGISSKYITNTTFENVKNFVDKEIFFPKIKGAIWLNAFFFIDFTEYSEIPNKINFKF